MRERSRNGGGMARHFEDWLQAYIDYASYTEAPKRFHFWSGVSAVAACLRRKAYFDQIFFKWFPNFFIILVAPPGIVSKSTTADVAMDLVKHIPDVKWGPQIVTWQSLTTSFAAALEGYQLNGSYYQMSAITTVSAELGNLLNPKDGDLINLLITLWDGRDVKKETKMSGNDSVINPWFNIIGCTTPSWIADNIPQNALEGGFASRCVWLYADTKDKLVPHLEDVVPSDLDSTKAKLIADLEKISKIGGRYRLSNAAKVWSAHWYADLWKGYNPDDVRMNGYFARKQTHLYKLSMVIAASHRDSLTLEKEDLIAANDMLTDMEPGMPKVFEKIGRSDQSKQVESFISYVRRKGEVSYEEAFRYLHAYFPMEKDLEGIITGCIRSGFVELKTEHGPVLVAKFGATHA